MPEMLEIEGGLARIVRRDVIREVALADAIKLIETRVPVSTPLLPTRTRTFRLNPTNNANWMIEVLSEREPKVRTITVYGEELTLSMPWTYFLHTYQSVDQGTTWMAYDGYAFFAKEAIKSEDDLLIPALLPNISSDGNICFGTGTRNYGTDLAPQIEGSINDFWLSTFTHGNMDPYWPGRRNTPRAWQLMTEREPDGWKDWREFDPDADHGHPFTPTAVHRLFHHITDRSQVLVTANAIPELRTAPTFGMAEEYWANLTPLQRTRLERGLALFRERADDAAFEPEPVLFTEDEDPDDEALF